MRRPVLFLLLCALIPATAGAQAVGNGVQAPEWSLKPDKPLKRNGLLVGTTKPKQTASAGEKMGPEVPKPQRLKLPKPKKQGPTTTTVRQDRPNAAPLIQAMQRGSRQRN